MRMTAMLAALALTLSALSAAVLAVPTKPLPWGDINFLQTTDVHGWLSGHRHEEGQDAQYSDLAAFLQHMKAEAVSRRKDLFIFDTGDLLEGTGLSDASSVTGQYVLPIISLLPYDAGSIGNHEGYKNSVVDNLYKNYIPKLHGRYITSNTKYNDRLGGSSVNLGSRFRIIDGQFGNRILVLGFLYNMPDSCDALVVQKVAEAIQEPWFIKVIETEHLSAVVVLSHMHIEADELNTIHGRIRALKPSLNVVFFAGHTHIRSYRVLDERSVALESGRYFDTVGFLSMTRQQSAVRELTIQEDSVAGGHLMAKSSSNLFAFNYVYIDANVDTFKYYVNRLNGGAFETALSRQIGSMLTEYRTILNLDDVLGCNIDASYLLTVPFTASNSIYHLVSSQVLPQTVSKDATRFFAVFGSGTIRYPLYSGTVTFDDIFALSPFKDEIQCVSNVPLSAARTLVRQLNGVTSDNLFVTGSTESKAADFAVDQRLIMANVAPSGVEVGVDDGLLLADASNVPSYLVVEPVGIDADALVDVVFLEYDEDRIVAALTTLLGKEVHAENYRDDFDSTTMWIKFVKDQWGANCAAN